MNQYLALMHRIREGGTKREDRTGVGTLSTFGEQLRFDLSKGFPALTTKKLHMRSIIHELLWFIRGETNVRSLQNEGVSIWDEWAGKDGQLGPIYGYQWRSWAGPEGQRVDQLNDVLHGLKNNPSSRRHVVSAWNPAQLKEMALPPCHILFQFYVAKDRLSCHLYQRSADIFLGLPFNIASYALLTLMMAHVIGYQPGEFIHTLGDAHLYLNHLNQVDEQLERSPYPLPTMQLNPDRHSLFDFIYTDFQLLNYQCHPHIKAPVAV